jgi:hypothetical protein
VTKIALLLILMIYAGLSQAQVANPLSADYYERLGVSRKVTPDELKATVKRLRKLYHPDTHPGVDVRYLQNINQAYDAIKGSPRAETRSGTSSGSPNDMDARMAQRAELMDLLYGRLDGLYGENGAVSAEGTDYELTILKFTFNQMATDKYFFEELMRKPGIRSMFLKAFRRPFWRDTKNGLFKGFIESWGFYTLRLSPSFTGPLFALLDPEDAYLQRVLYRADFYSPGNDFRSQANKEEIILMIAASMLIEPAYRNTPAGQKLLDRILRSWPALRDGRYPTYVQMKQVLEILKTLDVPEWAANSKLQRLILEIAKRRFDFGDQRETYEDFRKRYPSAFGEAKSPSATTQEALHDCSERLSNSRGTDR